MLGNPNILTIQNWHILCVALFMPKSIRAGLILARFMHTFNWWYYCSFMCFEGVLYIIYRYCVTITDIALYASNRLFIYYIESSNECTFICFVVFFIYYIVEYLALVIVLYLVLLLEFVHYHVSGRCATQSGGIL